MTEHWILNDPALEYHAASHRYILGDRELFHVTEVLEGAGYIDYHAPWFTQESKDRGTALHLAVKLINLNDLDESTIDSSIAGEVEGYRRFLRESRAGVIDAERHVCDPHTGYAGTFDVVFSIPGPGGTPILWLVDIKPALHPAVGPQTAAYHRCAAPFYQGRALMRGALVLHAGAYHLEPLRDPMDFNYFLAALRVVQFRRVHGIDHQIHTAQV